MDIGEIMQRLPHRYPFLLVDRILECDENHVVGLKNFTMNELFFQGHFPGEPVVPGVLLLEAMGQVASMLVRNLPGADALVAYLTSVDEAKFRRPVCPGDQLITEAKVIKVRGRLGKVSTVARVNGAPVAEAVLGFVLSRSLQQKGQGDE